MRIGIDRGGVCGVGLSFSMVVGRRGERFRVKTDAAMRGGRRTSPSHTNLARTQGQAEQSHVRGSSKKSTKTYLDDVILIFVKSVPDRSMEGIPRRPSTLIAFDTNTHKCSAPCVQQETSDEAFCIGVAWRGVASVSSSFYRLSQNAPAPSSSTCTLLTVVSRCDSQRVNGRNRR
jgi:hypothetical protein